jgi:hypothetical protein
VPVKLLRIARWAFVAAMVAGVMLVGAANSGAATEPNTSIYNYDVYYDNADFWFHSDVADATFQCRLDDEPFETCVSPVHYVGCPRDRTGSRCGPSTRPVSSIRRRPI